MKKEKRKKPNQELLNTLELNVLEKREMTNWTMTDEALLIYPQLCRKFDFF